MDLIPIQFSDLKVGQPLSWDLFDQERKPLMERGHVIKTTAELEELSRRSSVLLRLKASSEKIGAIDKKISEFNFDDMQLKVGDRLQLQLHSSAKSSCRLNNDTCMVTVIGYVPDHSLIVSMPKTDQLIGQPFLEGDQILVRLFSGRCAFSFTVFVDKLVKLSFKYLHLSFPKHILGQTIRKSRRVRTAIEAEATVNSGSIPLIITNLSAAGAEISTHTELGGIGTLIELSVKVKIHEKEISLRLQSIIRSFKAINKQDALRYGVEFTSLQAEQIFSLRSFIYQELVENPNNIV
ncbi:MAG: flagellar brake protein [Nitrosomonas sp.]|nr:flagellar brake protein [Nitrosomonas sp.]